MRWSDVSRLIPPPPAVRIFHVEPAGSKRECRIGSQREIIESEQMGTHWGATQRGGNNGLGLNMSEAGMDPARCEPTLPQR